MSTNNKDSYEDIDEAEEEALLKSDDECEGGKTNIPLNLLGPPSTSLTTDLIDDSSLLNDSLLRDTTSDEHHGKQEKNTGDLLDGENMLDSNSVRKYDDSTDEEESDKDEDSVKEELKEFQTILKELEVNQYAYDKYIRLCELSHATGDLDNIRKAYLSFSSVYPLTPELWQKYIDVELVVTQSCREIEKVEQLFRNALQDYYSCDLALKFADFAVRCKDPGAIWQEILQTYGINCLRGHEFFELYRSKYCNELPTREKINNYINSFVLELRFPLQEMEKTYIEFKVFYEHNKEIANMQEPINWSEINQHYFVAKDHLKRIIIYEKKLNELEAHAYRERAEVYFEYIKNADEFLDEYVLQSIYERMVADCCLNFECWIKYIDFIYYRKPFDLDVDLPMFKQTADDICKRALRNCTWSAELYIKRILIMEKLSNFSKHQVQEVLETALTAGFQTPEPVVSIWLEYLTYLRRQTDWNNPRECEILRNNFNLCWTTLGQQWGVLADCNCEILQFWGRLEYGPLQNPKKGKELWNTVMESSDNATKSGLWIEFALLEMRYDLEATRKLFSKALHTVGLDNSSVIVAAWERFERCNGSIKTLNNCLKECNFFKEEQQHNTSYNNNKPSKSNSSNNKPVKRKLHVHESDYSIKQPKLQVEKIKTEKGHAVKDTNYKEHENQEIDLTKDHLRIFLSNLDYNLSEKEIVENLPEIKILKLELIRSGNGKSRGFGYAELETETEVEKALTLDRKSINGRPLFITSVLRDKEQRQKFKYNADKEPHKLFIKSLPHDSTQAELEKIFAAYGKLKDVRLVYHKSGNFKQIAYVEYEQESSASKAVLATDNMSLRGHNISVAISAPPPKPTTSTTVNPIKMLGFAPKRKANDLKQKPRMSLIPTVVRKNLNTNATAHTSNNVTKPLKSNEDFRKFFTK